MASMLDDFLTYGSGAAPGTMAAPSGGGGALNDMIAQNSARTASMSNTVDPQGRPVDPTAIASVDPVEVTASSPPSPPIHYNNSDDVQDVQKALQANPRVDGGTGRGLWGLLPQNIQHGTVRDILGHLGDAFLVHAGQRPMYQDRVNERTIGQAMAGYANNPQAAIERMAATGAPGSVEMAEKMEQNYGNLQIRKQIQEQNNQYRQSMMQSRNDQSFQRMLPYAGGMVQGITDPAQYKIAYDKLNTIAKRIDPNADATTAWGIPSPEEFQPGMLSNSGKTGGQVGREAVSRESIQERAQGSQWAHHDREYRNTHPTTQPTMSSQLNTIRDKVNNGETLSAGDQQVWNRFLHGTKGGGGSGLHPSTTAGAGNGQGPTAMKPGTTTPDGYQVFSPEQARAAAANPANKGKKYYGADGQLRVFH